MSEFQPGVYHGLTETQYSAIPAVRSSMLRDFMSKTPAHWKHDSEQPPEPDKKCFAEGRALHMAVLEPERFERHVRERRRMPTAEELGFPDFRTKAARELRDQARAEIEAECEGAEYVLDTDEFERVQRMAEALRSDPDFADILKQPHETELTVVWRDEETEILCKCRFDIWLPDPGRFLELKKTRVVATPENFSREMRRFGYAHQCAWYLEGAKAQLGGVEQRDPVSLAVVEDFAPHLVAVRPVNQPTLLTAGVEMHEALRRYAQCVRSKFFPGHDNAESWYLPGHSEGQELGLTFREDALL